MTYQPRYTNLVAMFLQATEKFADQPLFGTRASEGWRWTSYRQFRSLVDAARAGLHALGVQRGDRVAVISNNRLEWAVCAYGTYTLGAVYVPMYEAQLDKDWEFILRDSGAKLCLVASEVVRKRVEALRATLPDLQRVIELGSADYQQLLARPDAPTVASTTPDDADVATLIYTSGTTGAPKGVRLTQRNLAANVSALLDVAPVRHGDRSLAFLPWAHVFGGCIELNTLMAVGGSLAICDNTDKLLGYLPEVKPTILLSVPRIWNRIYDGVQKQIAGRPKLIQAVFAAAMSAKSKRKHGQALSLGERLALPLGERLIFAKIAQRFGGELRFAVSGAAALAPEVAEFIDNLGIQVYEGYGMTESSGSTTANYPGSAKLGTVGRPVPGVEIKLDKQVPGAQGDEGEILIYGTGVMAGYHNQPEATKHSITEDGGLRSGDLGRIDSDGFLVITGRVKELYKLQNGKYVAPAPLEEKLQLSPFIAQCVVYGADQRYNVALIVPDMTALQAWAQANGVPTEQGALLADPRTRALFRKEIDEQSHDFKGYEQIRDFALSAEELTPANDMLTPTLKLKRRNVMTRYQDRLLELYRDSKD
jgi:long-chain acyl-CoA synthetase